MILRKFVFTSYIRTINPRLNHSDVNATGILRQTLESDSFPNELAFYHKPFLDRANVIQNFLAMSKMCVMKKTTGDSFMINDAGPVFDDLDNPSFASYAIGPDTALFFYTGELRDKDVVYCNRLALEQCNRFVTFRSINELSDTFSRLNITTDRMKRHSCLMRNVLNHDKADMSSTTLTEKQRRVLSELETPNCFYPLLNEDWNGVEIDYLIENKQIETVSALIIFNRFVILHITELNRWQYCFDCYPDKFLLNMITRYENFARCKFDRCISALIMEILADRGYSRFATSIAKMYGEGGYVPANTCRSELYYEIAAEKGDPDAITHMIKQAFENDNENSNSATLGITF